MGEVDSTPAVVEEAPEPKAKKKIQIEEVDSTPAVVEEAPKPKAKKKIQIEEVDSDKPVEAPVALPPHIAELQQGAAAMQSAANFDNAIELYKQAICDVENMTEAPQHELASMYIAAAKCCKQVQD